jgi:hypothetical protein
MWKYTIVLMILSVESTLSRELPFDHIRPYWKLESSFAIVISVYVYTSTQLLVSFCLADTARAYTVDLPAE